MGANRDTFFGVAGVGTISMRGLFRRVNLMLEEDREDVIVLTSGGRAGNVYNIAKMPSIVILDSDGKIAYRNEHYVIENTINEIKAKIDELR